MENSKGIEKIRRLEKAMLDKSMGKDVIAGMFGNYFTNDSSVPVTPEVIFSLGDIRTLDLYHKIPRNWSGIISNRIADQKGVKMLGAVIVSYRERFL